MRVLWNEMRANIYYCTLDTYFFNANSKFETQTYTEKNFKFE